MRRQLKPGALLAPVPAVLVSCADGEERNVITVAWTGVLCSDPPAVYVSVRPARHSHGIISRSGELVINLVSEDMARAADLCGVKSGRDCDKAALAGLDYCESTAVRAPSIAQSPLSLECRVRQVLHMGAHDAFVCDVVAVTADEGVIEPDGRLALDKAGLISYSHGEYFSQGRKLGFFGYSVARPKTLRRRAAGGPKRPAAKGRSEK